MKYIMKLANYILTYIETHQKQNSIKISCCSGGYKVYVTHEEIMEKVRKDKKLFNQ